LIAGAAVAGPLAVVRPWAVAIVLATAFLALLARRAPRLGWVVVIACLGFVATGVRAAAVIEGHARTVVAAHALVPRPDRCVIQGAVVGLPLRRGVLMADVTVDAIDCGEPQTPSRPLRARIYDLPWDVARGDVVEAIVQIAPSRRANDPDLGDPRPGPARRGHVLSGSALSVEVRARGRSVAAHLDRIRAHLRRGLDQVVAAELGPVARAIVLGEEDLAADDDEAFRRSGLTHLLAVSGGHVALVVGGLVALLRAVVLRIERISRQIEAGRIACAIGIPLSVAYDQLAGDSGSARRATAMAIVVLVVRVCGRKPDAIRALAASALVAVAIDPLAPFDLSFALSLAATVGLLAIGPVLKGTLDRTARLPQVAKGALAATLAASLACAPLLAQIAGAIPLAGIVANLVAVPIGELAALPLCNAAAALGAIGLGTLARIVGHAAGGAIVLLRGVARITSAPSFAVVAVPPPTAIQLAIMIAAAVAAYLAAPRRRGLVVIALVATAALLLAEGIHLRDARPHGRLRITVLDVGQGDSILVDLPDGRAILVDGGGEVGSTWDPGRAVVTPVLSARRRERLAVAILSHPHPDHYLGLRHPLAAVRVDEFWDTGESEGRGLRGELGELLGSLRARGSRIVRPEGLCGAPRLVGGARVEVLHPCPAADLDRHTNDNSFVVRIGFGRRHALLVGDAEAEAEATLVAHARDRLAADFLKVGHHGSRTSSSEPFLAAVSPSVAAISCGARNRFGHPHRTALGRLSATGARILRTDREGAIRWTTDGDVVDVATAREGW
jgi:competence protein ComEC